VAEIDVPLFVERVVERSNFSLALTAVPRNLLLVEDGSSFSIPHREQIEQRFGVTLVLADNCHELLRGRARESDFFAVTDEKLRVSWAAVIGIRVPIGGRSYDLVIRRPRTADGIVKYGLVGGALEIPGALGRFFPADARPESPARPDEFRFSASRASVAVFERSYRDNIDGLGTFVTAAARANALRELVEELVLEDDTRLLSIEEAREVFVHRGLLDDVSFDTVAQGG